MGGVWAWSGLRNIKENPTAATNRNGRATRRDNLFLLVSLFINVFSEPPYNENWNEEKTLKCLEGFYNQAKEFFVFAEIDDVPVGFISSD